MRLAHARLLTNDVPGLTAFYRDLTGLAAIGDANYAEFHDQALNLAISGRRVIDLHTAGLADPSASRSMLLDFQVPDVDAERLRLQALVRKFLPEPTTQPWGNRSMLFRDPDGNLINVFSTPRR